MSRFDTIYVEAYEVVDAQRQCHARVHTFELAEAKLLALRAQYPAALFELIAVVDA